MAAKRWDTGTDDYIEATVRRRWNGSQWVRMNGWRWDGLAWVPLWTSTSTGSSTATSVTFNLDEARASPGTPVFDLTQERQQ